LIPANTTTSIVIVGLDNPRNNKPTAEFKIWTFDSNGISEIDSGFNIGTQMTTFWKIDNFEVQPTIEINGASSRYNFTISTKTEFVAGDVVHFTFPRQVTLPSDPAQI
jgi:hypothetical protein